MLGLYCPLVVFIQIIIHCIISQLIRSIFCAHDVLGLQIYLQHMYSFGAIYCIHDDHNNNNSLKARLVNDTLVIIQSFCGGCLKVGSPLAAASTTSWR